MLGEILLYHHFVSEAEPGGAMLGHGCDGRLQDDFCANNSLFKQANVLEEFLNASPDVQNLHYIRNKCSIYHGK